MGSSGNNSWATSGIRRGREAVRMLERERKEKAS